MDIVSKHCSDSSLTNDDLVSQIAAVCSKFYIDGWKNGYDAHSPDAYMDPVKNVRSFMAAFGQPLPGKPQWPDDKTMDLRVRLKGEEFMEWVRDSGYDADLSIWNNAATPGDTCVFSEIFSGKRDFAKSADALIDDLYVTIGSLLAMGINMWPLWAAVHAANMAKSGGPVIDGKVRKPEGWQPPDIAAQLRLQGWEGDDAK